METVGTNRRKDAFCVEQLSRLPFYAVELHVFYLIPKFAAYLAASWIHGALILQDQTVCFNIVCQPCVIIGKKFEIAGIITNTIELNGIKI
jgi:hypothetical protein